MMKSNSTGDQNSITSQNLIQFIQKSIIVYLIFTVALPIFCMIFGWRTLDDIGNGFIYGSLCLVLFGTLTFAGNTVPDQLSKLSLPKYKSSSAEHQKETVNDGSKSRNNAIELFLTSLVCGALLSLTGLILKIL